MKHFLSLKTEDAVLSEADTVVIKDEMFEEDHTQEQRLFIRDGGEWIEEHKPPIMKLTEVG